MKMSGSLGAVCSALLDHVTQPPRFSSWTAIGSISQYANKEEERASIIVIISVFQCLEFNIGVYHCTLWCQDDLKTTVCICGGAAHVLYVSVV